MTSEQTKKKNRCWGHFSNRGDINLKSIMLSACVYVYCMFVSEKCMIPTPIWYAVAW